MLDVALEDEVRIYGLLAELRRAIRDEVPRWLAERLLSSFTELRHALSTTARVKDAMQRAEQALDDWRSWRESEPQT